MACITKKHCKLVIDFYDQHGKRRLKTLPKGTTKGEARKILHDILKQVDKGIFLPDKRILILPRISGHIEKPQVNRGNTGGCVHETEPKEIRYSI